MEKRSVKRLIMTVSVVLICGFAVVLPAAAASVKIENDIHEIISETVQTDGVVYFNLGQYGVKIIVPDSWAGKVLLTELDFGADKDVKGAYGFLLNPGLPAVELVQYVGALFVYDNNNRHDPEAGPGQIKLADLNGHVFVYLNSLFNQYPDLKQAELFDALTIPHDEISLLIKVEKLD